MNNKIYSVEEDDFEDTLDVDEFYVDEFEDFDEEEDFFTDN